jgi:hypothetical protein
VAKVQGTINGTLLHSIAYSPDHSIEFYDFGEGAVGARERQSVGSETILDTVARPSSLTDLYRLVAPNSQVPQAIVAADARVAEYNRRFPVTADAVENSIPEEMAQPPAGSEEQIDQLSQASVLCSADFFGDGWGGQWFIDNFATSADFRNLGTNTDFAWWSTTYEWFRWKTMNGDFNVNGHTTGKRNQFPYPTPRILWDYDILPRDIEIWTIGPGSYWKYANASNPCFHTHWISLRWD